MPDIGNRTVLAFDFGTKSIGVAVGQEITGTASPLAAPLCHLYCVECSRFRTTKPSNIRLV